MVFANGQGKKPASRPKAKRDSSIISNWVDDFTALTEPLASPEIFRRWAGISAVAGALERKVWVYTKGSKLYPNLYVTLCAPPGIGKTEVIDITRQLWGKLEEHHVANSNVTKASLIDGLNAAERRVIRIGEATPVVSFNSLLISSNELGVLITAYDNEFMSALTDLYDGKHYSESRRTNKLQIDIENPNLNLIAGCTPGYLRENIPMGAWDQGFLSRVVIVYSGERKLRSVFTELENTEDGLAELSNRLQDIGDLYGRYSFTEEVKTMFDAWYLGGQAPLPDHPRLINYSSRRGTHILKLMMVAAASESSELMIEAHHLTKAFEWLFEAEFYMPDIFKAMATGGDSQTIEDTFHHLYALYMKGGKVPIGEHRLVHFLQERTPAHNIVRIIETMERARMIEKCVVKGLGTAYVPLKMGPT